MKPIISRNTHSSRTRQWLALSATAALLATAHPAFAAGDADKGADVFAENCAECHSMTAGKNKKGPSLFAVVGRKGASIDTFKNYSNTLRSGDITWTEDKLDAYIAEPDKVVPGGKMKFDGLADAAQRADLIAFLAKFK